MNRSLLVLLAVCACNKPAERPAEKPKPVDQFKPLTNESDDTFKVGPFTPSGRPLPEGATLIELNGDTAPVTAPKVLLVPLGDTYLAQVNVLLAALDDAGSEV